MGSCVSKPRDPDLPGNTSAFCPAPALNPAHPISSSAFPANVYKPHSQLKLNESSLTESPRRTSEEQVIALFPYTSRADGDLSFQKGDVMILLESTNTDWWYVRTKDGKRQGYVPRKFVAVRTTVESEEWFAGPISRSQAERLVLSGNMPAGTFLVRQRDVNPTEYALTIRDRDTGAAPTCKHYRIKLLDNNEGFYITPRSKFKTLKHLVRYYSDNADGLCTILSFPAPRLAPVRPDLSSETQRSWEIPRHEIQLKDKLGDGNFGEVWRGKWRGTVEVAIKTMKPGTMSNDAFLAEAQIMKHCDHPNLVKLYAVCTKEEPFFIITEYMQGGALLAFLKDDRNQITLQAMVEISAQVANGMTYLENKKLVHRDLAARNVLVGEKISGLPVVKICDFGLARMIEEDIYEARMGAKFPIKWTPVEAAAHGNFTVKSDVWSYGVLLWEVFSRGASPYPGMSNREVLEQVERGYRMPCPKHMPQELYTEVLLKCWNANPDLRPTFAFLFSFLDDFGTSTQNQYLRADP